ncbi:hypothetical protein [Streptomyces sp. NPDC048623]|uniref:hypothetical protein n=1 Tax=Streptomyces sp. NPDC048623 TaxID=3155761 RepID=UPI003419706D
MATPERADHTEDTESDIVRVPMRELLAACAAATAVSTPPREREPGAVDGAVDEEPGAHAVHDEAA